MNCFLGPLRKVRGVQCVPLILSSVLFIY